MMNAPNMLIPGFVSIGIFGLIAGIALAKYFQKLSSAPYAEELQESRLRERKIVENAVDVICVLDVESKFLSASPSVMKRWGYTENELKSMKLTDLLHQDDKNKSLEAVLGAKHSIDQISFENRLLRKNGQLIDLNWSAHWSAKDNGLFCVARDITERKRAEAALEASETRLRTTLETLPIGVVCTTLAGTIEFVNQSFAKCVNMNMESLKGKQFSELILENESFKRMVQEQNQAVDSSKPDQESFTLNSGTDKIAAELRVASFQLGSSPRLLITVTDITQRKEVEQFRREFVAMVNHDLRSPLCALKMQIDMLEVGLHGDMSKANREVCAQAQVEIARLLNLVNDLLDLEKIETLTSPLKKMPVAVSDVVETAAASLAPFAQSREIQILHSENELACMMDRSRIIQVLVNLLSNAIKFSPSGSTVKIESERRPPDEIIIKVIDQGRGIPPERASELFNRFRQVQTDDERAGSGLGLSISKAIIDAHHGKIGCKSEGENGSTFWFALEPCE